MLAKIFYTFIFSFFLSIFLYTFEINIFFYIILFLLIGISIFILLKFYKKTASTFLILIIIFSVGFFLGYFRFKVFEKINYPEFNHLLLENIKTKMIISSEPEKRKFRTKLILKFPDSHSKAIAWIPNYPRFNYGDLVKIDGFLVPPKNFKSRLGRDFDYISYLKKDNVFYELKIKEINFIEGGHGHPLKTILFEFKNKLLINIQKYIPVPESFLLGGILLGEKEDMGKELLADFRETGVIHIVVLSGYNLTLVAVFFLKLFSFLGVTASSILASFGIILFTLMVGAGATVVRAAIMALLVIVAKLWGRDAHMIKVLFLTGFIMVFFNPMILTHSASFQLSFLATLGLFTLGKFLEKIFNFVPEKLEFRAILSATIATQIFVAPLLIYMMGEVSVISPIVNILILIFVPLTMFAGLLLMLSAFLSPILATIIGFFTFLLLAYILFIINFFAELPITVAQFQLEFSYVILIYLIFFIIYLIYNKLILNKKNI